MPETLVHGIVTEIGRRGPSQGSKKDTDRWCKKTAILMKVTKSTAIDATVSSPAGCVVVLEPGAKWPEQAFAGVGDREGVAVVSGAPGVAAEHFFKRLARQFAHIAANGVLIRTVIVACAVSGAAHSIDHNQLVAHVQNHSHFAANGSVIFVGPTAD